MRCPSRRQIAVVLAALLLAGCTYSGPRSPELRWLEGGRPAYPAGARAEGAEGHVVVEYRVDEEGRVQDARVIESSPPGVFDGAALAAIRSWRYRPFDDGTGPREVDGVRSRFDFRLGEAYPGL
jgi:TonB family protein